MALCDFKRLVNWSDLSHMSNLDDFSSYAAAPPTELHTMLFWDELEARQCKDVEISSGQGKSDTITGALQTLKEST